MSESHARTHQVHVCQACEEVLPTHACDQLCACGYRNIFPDHQKVQPPITRRYPAKGGGYYEVVDPDMRCKGKASCGGDCVLKVVDPGKPQHVHICEGDSVDHTNRGIAGTCRGPVPPPAPPTPEAKPADPLPKGVTVDAKDLKLSVAGIPIRADYADANYRGPARP